MKAGPKRRDFAPTAKWHNLRKRAELLARTRSFFHQRGFLEVETPLLSADVVVDRYLDPLCVTLPSDVRKADEGRKLWLQTSPEFAMKRLLAAGGKAIYQITRAFRAAEAGPLHNPEFTIVEWYRRGEDMRQGMQMLSDLSETLLDCGPAEMLSYQEAFERYAKINPHAATVEELAAVAAGNGISVSASFQESDRDGWLNLLLAHLVESHLGQAQPTILFQYPAAQAALARLTPDGILAERFELYVRGIELANGYHELLDADVLRGRNRAANAHRASEGKPPLPEDSHLLAAMDAGLPDCTGVALGFDRVVMLAAGASSLAEVMAFPIDRA